MFGKFTEELVKEEKPPAFRTRLQEVDSEQGAVDGSRRPKRSRLVRSAAARPLAEFLIFSAQPGHGRRNRDLIMIIMMPVHV